MNLMLVALALVPSAGALHFLDASGVKRSWRRRGVYPGRADVLPLAVVAADVRHARPRTHAWPRTHMHGI